MNTTHKTKPQSLKDKIYHFILGFIQDNGYSPTVRDISDGLTKKGYRITPAGVQYWLRHMRDKEGIIDFVDNKLRTITIKKK